VSAVFAVKQRATAGVPWPLPAPLGRRDPARMLLRVAIWTALSQEIPRTAFRVTGNELTVAAISAVLTIVCVLFHYEVMSLTSRYLPQLGTPRRARIVALIFAMLLAHVVEVWLFGLTYWLLDRWPALGTLQGEFHEGALDFVYYSVTVFTTLGFGDIVPYGAVRILTGTEALIGLGLITWSASLAFLEMQHDWAEFRRARSNHEPPRGPSS